MYKCFTVISLLILLGSVQADINDQLQAHYSLKGDLKDATGSYLNAVNKGATWTTDKNGNANSALKFTGNNQVVEIPNVTLMALQDFTISFWIKSDKPSDIARSLISMGTFGGIENYFFIFQRVLGILNQQNQQTLKQYLLENNYLNGHWQHIAISRYSNNQKYLIFVDGKLFETIDVSEADKKHPMDNTSFIIGNHKSQGQYREVYQFYGSITDLRIYRKAFTVDDAIEVRDSTAGPATDHQICANYLAELYPGITTEKISFQYDSVTEQFYHQYYINFNTFTLDTSCFESKVWIGYNILYHSVYDNKIDLRFSWDDAVNLGCDQYTPTQQQCQIHVQLYFRGTLQHQKLFTSIINTPNLDDLTSQLSLNIIDDEDQSLQDFDKSIQSQMKFCSDIACVDYIAPTQILRNTDVFIEYKILTPGYDQYYPIHKRLAIDGQDVVIENQAAIDTWQEQGRIIYHIRPPISSPTALLVIGVSLSKTNPHGGRRILQGQQDEIALQDEQRDNIGKYIRVQIVDQEGKLVEHKQKQEDDSNDNNSVAIVSISVVALISILAGIGVFYKLKKSKSNKYSQDQQIEPTSPKSQNSDEKFNVQVQ